MRDELPDEVRIVTKAALDDGAPPTAPSPEPADNFVYRPGRPALALFDYDTKGMPRRGGAAAQSRWRLLGGAGVGAPCARRRPATCCGCRPAPGLAAPTPARRSPGPAACTSMSSITDGADAVRFLKTLHARCWLAGFGWMNVGAAGQLLERSIIDRMVGAAERLVFEGPPVVEPPLRQDAAARRRPSSPATCSTRSPPVRR